MKHVSLLVLLTYASSVTANPSFASLSSSEQSTLEIKLAKWKALYGLVAESHGFLPAHQESLSPESHTIDELERFHATVLEAKEAAKLNPHATFSEFNQFALMTSDEFKNLLVSSFGNQMGILTSDTHNLLQEDTVTEVDWSESKCMSPVKTQGGCGSCWAFATVGTVEMAHCLTTGEQLDLAEQQIVSCDSRNYGCRGGFPSMAINWLQNGICTEDTWPYTSGLTKETGKCSMTCEKKKLSIGKTITGRGETALQNILARQPVTVAVEAGNPVWKNYKSGVVTQCPGRSSDHAVIAVGFGNSTNPFFKIKNSWGAQWGENGYIYLQRGVNGRGVCNVAESLAYPELLSKTPRPQLTTQTTKAPTLSPTETPLTNIPSTVPTPSNSATSRPTSTNPSTIVPTLSPSSPKPSTFTPVPTNRPKKCGSCKGCYFADVKWCVHADIAMAECQSNQDALWCGA